MTVAAAATLISQGCIGALKPRGEVCRIDANVDELETN